MRNEVANMLGPEAGTVVGASLAAGWTRGSFCFANEAPMGVRPFEHVPKKLLDFFDIKTSDISDVS
jgi:hypothetical protein